MKKQTNMMLLSSIALLSMLPLTTSCGANNQLRIALECNYAPFNWTESSQTDYTLPIANKFNQFADGYDIQIAKLLGEKLNKEVLIMKTAWESIIPDLQMGTVDLVIAGMTDTPERRQSIDFSDEYYRSELVLITKADIANTYKEPLSSEELGILINGKVCVSQAFTVTDDVLDIFKDQYGSVHASPLDSFASCATDVSNGSAFLMTAELPVAESIVSNNDTLGIIHIDQEILGEKQSELGVSIGIKKGNEQLKNEVNEALKTISNKLRTSMMIDAVKRSNNK